LVARDDWRSDAAKANDKSRTYELAEHSHWPTVILLGKFWV